MNIESLSIGDKIEFGYYIYNCGAGRTVPFSWTVIDIKDGTALILCDKLPVDLPYHDEEGEIDWENCSLRHWLNNYFLNDSFTPEEIEKIVDTVHPEGSVTDRIFLLSSQEIDEFLDDKNVRASDGVSMIPSRMARKLFSDDKEGDEYWWTRDVVKFDPRFGSMVRNVDLNGFYTQTPSYSERWVRPACRIKLG